MAEKDFEDQNVVASFPDEQSAARAQGAARQASGGRADTEMGSRQDRVTSARGEMREELEQSWGGPGVGFATKEQTAGGLIFTVLGGAAGVALGIVLALAVPLGGWSLLARMVLWVVVGAVAGSTAGVIIGGKVGPDVKRSGESMASERGTTVSVHSDDPSAAQRAADALEQEGPDRVDTVDRRGEPRGRAD